MQIQKTVSTTHWWNRLPKTSLPCKPDSSNQISGAFVIKIKTILKAKYKALWGYPRRTGNSSSRIAAFLHIIKWLLGFGLLWFWICILDFCYDIVSSRSLFSASRFQTNFSSSSYWSRNPSVIPIKFLLKSIDLSSMPPFLFEDGRGSIIKR